MTPADLLTTQPSTVYQGFEEPERLRAVAETYWRAMLSAGVLLGAIAVAGGAYMLLMTFFNLSTNHAGAGTSQTLNRAELTRVAHGLSMRSESFTMLQTATSTVADPSR